jgi:putative transposase
MPRRHRNATGGYVYHVLNRAVGRATILKPPRSTPPLKTYWRKPASRCPCVCSPLPRAESLASGVVVQRGWRSFRVPAVADQFAHARWHLAHDTVGTGPRYQGRFKSFPIAEGEHFTTVCRYVERNAAVPPTNGATAPIQEPAPVGR